MSKTVNSFITLELGTHEDLRHKPNGLEISATSQDISNPSGLDFFPKTPVLEVKADTTDTTDSDDEDLLPITTQKSFQQYGTQNQFSITDNDTDASIIDKLYHYLENRKNKYANIRLEENLFQKDNKKYTEDQIKIFQNASFHVYQNLLCTPDNISIPPKLTINYGGKKEQPFYSSASITPIASEKKFIIEHKDGNLNAMLFAAAKAKKLLGGNAKISIKVSSINPNLEQLAELYVKLTTYNNSPPDIKFINQNGQDCSPEENSKIKDNILQTQEFKQHSVTAESKLKSKRTPPSKLKPQSGYIPNTQTPESEQLPTTKPVTENHDDTDPNHYENSTDQNIDDTTPNSSTSTPRMVRIR